MRALFSPLQLVGRPLRVGLPAGLVLAAGGRAIRLIDQNVIAAARAYDAVNRLAELIVPGLGSVLAARLWPADRHCRISSWIVGHAATNFHRLLREWLRPPEQSARNFCLLDSIYWESRLTSG